MTRILGIDCSLFKASAALVEADRVLAEDCSTDNFVGAEALLGLIHRVIVSPFEAIAVIAGPGSYTGIRSSIATAQGLAYSLKVPIFAVPLFECVAHYVSISLKRMFPNSSFSILVSTRANKAEYFCSGYVCSPDNNTTQGRVSEVFPCTSIAQEAFANSQYGFPAGNPSELIKCEARDGYWSVMATGIETKILLSNASLAALFLANRSDNHRGEANFKLEHLHCKELKPIYGKGVQAKTIAERMISNIPGNLPGIKPSS